MRAVGSRCLVVEAQTPDLSCCGIVVVGSGSCSRRKEGKEQRKQSVELGYIADIPLPQYCLVAGMEQGKIGRNPIQGQDLSVQFADRKVCVYPLRVQGQ